MLDDLVYTRVFVNPLFMKYLGLNRTVISVFKRFGFRLRRESTCVSIEQSTFEFYQYMLRQCPTQTVESGIASVVFSKDRAMQLHAFIGSFLKHVKNRGSIYILYKTSNDQHKESYKELADIFSHEEIIFLEEHDFRPQLIKLCEGFTQDKLVFYADDFIFLRPIDYRKILPISSDEKVFSLILGRDLNYMVHHKCNIVLPKLSPTTDGFLSFSWNSYQTPGNWTYPLTVSGHIFGRLEMCAMLSSITFAGPNSLELGLQVFSPIFSRREGVCPENVVLTIIEANMVQTEVNNSDIEIHSIEELLAAWNDGKQIDIDFFNDQPISEVQLMRYNFTRRKISC